MKKPTILVLLAYYLPGYKAGGPLRTIENMVERLCDEFDFRIITSDRDLGEREPYPNVAVDRWNSLGNAEVFYASAALQSFRGLAALIRATPHEALYLNSYFHPRFAISPLLARRLKLLPERPTVLAPRGEMSEGALMLHRYKKMAYRAAALLGRVHRGLIWQASSDYEKAEIRRFIRRAGELPPAGVEPIFVAPDLPPAPTLLSPDVEPASPRPSGDPLRICFISRISPKKNLDFALRLLQRVKASVVFDIYGPLEDRKYWTACKGLIAAMPENITVNYLGTIEHDRVGEAFRSHDLFLFPTRGENFGHVILEAMCAGTPLLLSDATPWRNLQDIGVGWDLSLDDSEGFVSAIESAAALDTASYAEWRDRVRRYGHDCATNTDVLRANRMLFLNAIAGQS